MSGKHTKYVVYVYQTDGNVNHSDDIKLAVNQSLGTKGNVNRVHTQEKEEDIERVRNKKV